MRASILGTVSVLFVLSSCAQLPPMRNADSFPREKVMARIKCELVTAVTAVAAVQSTPDYRQTMFYFNIPEYTATIVLQDQSDVAQGLAAGGNWQSSSGPHYNKFSGGGADFKGFGFSGKQQQYNSATRAVPLRDIVSSPVRKNGPYGLVDSDLTAACREKKYTAVTTAGTVGVGRPLNIAERLTAIISETKEVPTFVTEQKMHFEFSVLVGTGGTMSFVHPLSDQAAGAGANIGLLEKLDIVITRNAKG